MDKRLIKAHDINFYSHPIYKGTDRKRVAVTIAAHINDV